MIEVQSEPPAQNNDQISSSIDFGLKDGEKEVNISLIIFI